MSTTKIKKLKAIVIILFFVVIVLMYFLQQYSFWVFIGLILLLLALIYIYENYLKILAKIIITTIRDKNKYQKKYNELYDEICKANIPPPTEDLIPPVIKRQISDDIKMCHFTRRAFLPNEIILKEYFTDYFILDKPRDIVGGDFYWFNQKERKLILAVADGTGFGVAGASLSFFGMYLLQNILNKHDIELLTPAKILTELRTRFIHDFSRSDQTEQHGFDMSICIFDKYRSEMQFSGAFHDILVINNNEIQKLKPNRFPIALTISSQTEFTNQTISIYKGDKIYLYTDGYKDQFGGEKGRKIMFKGFKNLISEINLEPMEKQKNALEKYHNDYRSQPNQEYDQIDDVLVVGVEI